MLQHHDAMASTVSCQSDISDASHIWAVILKCVIRTKRRIIQFIEDLGRPHVLDTALDDGYRPVAADKKREAEALTWCNALSADAPDEAW